MGVRILSLVTAIALTLSLRAQTESDVRMSEGGYGLVRTNISVAYDHAWGDVLDSFNARVSYEFVSKRFLTLSANFKHNSVNTDFGRDDLGEAYDPEAIGLNDTQTMQQIGLTATAGARLAGRPVRVLALLNSEWGKGGFNRVTATLTGLIMVRATRSTQFGVGVLGMINTTSKVPVFPVFVYRHRFNDRWAVNLYGAMMGFDFTPTRTDMVSVGADINVKSFYFRPHAVGLPSTCRYTQTDFRPMLKYRRRLMHCLYLDAMAGYAVNMKTRVNGVNGTKEYITISRRPAPFVQASVSYSL